MHNVWLVIALVIVVAAVFIGINGWPEPNPVDVAEGAKINAEARILEQNAEQSRLIDKELHDAKMQEKAYRQAVWNSWQPVIVAVGKFAIKTLYIYVVVLLAVGSYSTVKIGQSFVQATDLAFRIRGGVVPIDKKTRLERTFVYEPQLATTPKTSGLLAKVEKQTGLSFNRTHDEKWVVINSANGKVLARFDENLPADDRLTEIKRQAVIHWITMNNMKDSGLLSRDGEVAEAMAVASPAIPGESVNVMAFRDMIEMVVKGVKDELQEVQ